MSLYGYGRETTPHLDRFFDDRSVFTNASSSAPCTVPSIKQFLSGDFDARNRPLASVLSDNGYQTAAVVSQHMFQRHNKINEYKAGFQHWDIQPLEQRDQHDMTTRTATEVTNRAVAWLRQYIGTGKFFLWVHYFDPHDPYEPPQQFRRWSIPESSYADGDLRRHLKQGRKPGQRWNFAGDIFSQADVEHFIGLYDAEILYVDFEVNRILESLVALGVMSNTMVILTSDHGELLGEGNTWVHCLTVQELETRVPLAIKLPHEAHPPASLRRGPVSTLDIYPTILSALGIDYSPNSLDGRDLRAAFPDRRAIASFRGKVAIKDERWKLLVARQGASYQPAALFDLHHDPMEQRNVIHEHPAIKEALFQDMASYLLLANQRARANEETLEQLKALGYIE